MARHPFGGDISAWIFSVGGSDEAILTGGVTITFWTALTGGSQYTDLTSDAAGVTVIDHVTSSDGTDGLTIGSIPVLYGPDGVVSMYAAADGGPRVLMLATDTPTAAAEAAAGVLSAAAQIAQHIGSQNPHGTSLRLLSDVNMPGTLLDGVVPMWDDTTGKWLPGEIEGIAGVVELDGAQTIVGPKTFALPLGTGTAITLLAAATSEIDDLLQAWSGTDTGAGGSRALAFRVSRTGEVRVRAASLSSTPIKIHGHSGQEANLFEALSPTEVPTMWIAPDGRVRAPNVGHVFALSIGGDVSLGVGKHRIYNDTGVTLTLLSARASVGTAPTGALDLVVDVNKNGTTVFTSQAFRPTIAVTTFTSGKVTAINETTFLDGDYLTIDVDSVGTVVPGADLVVQIMAA